MTFLQKCLGIKTFNLHPTSGFKLLLSYSIPLFDFCTASDSAVIINKMASHIRYFNNELLDYDENKKFCLQRDIMREHMMEIIQLIENKQPAVGKYSDGGLYVGVAGIAYMYLHLSTSPIFSDKRDDFIRKGLEYIKLSEKCQNRRTINDPADVTGFLLGGSGIYAVGACLNKFAGERKAMESCITNFNAACDKCKPLHYLPYGSDEFLVGRAGYISGALWLNRVFESKVVPVEDIVGLCKAMYDSGIEYAMQHRSKSPLMYSYYDTEYLGAAHGLSTILQMMLSVPEFKHRYPDVFRDIQDSVDFLLSLQTPEGNFPCAMDEIGHRTRPVSEDLIHWCHGAPGVVYLMARAYLIWKDKKYLDSCLKCGELVWKKGLLKKGPGICHGVAGNGYVFLMLYRLTKNKKYLYRAEQFAEFLFSKQFKAARTPDCPYSLYEGLAGTVCFLNDVMQPETATFPFIEVF